MNMENVYSVATGFWRFRSVRGRFMNRSTAAILTFLSVLIFTNRLIAKGIERKVQISAFGTTKDRVTVYRYVLSNKKGVEAVVISYGAALNSLKIPDRDGKVADVVLAYDDIGGYEQDKAYFGATIGRYGNRIAGGQFVLDGTTFHIPKNDGPNTLHGGTTGFNKRIWVGVDRSRADAEVLELSYTSPDGEEGFPGTLKVTVTYTLPADKNELRIDYSATTDKDTVLNLTNHSYFNLSGVPSQEILNHQLMLRAQEFTPVNSALITTGELRPVAGTPFDFTKATAIGSRINQEDEQLKFGRGYDHNWVLEGKGKAGLQLAAQVFEPTSGRMLEVLTTEPGIQLYTGNFLDGTVRGKGGQFYARRTAFCLETQHFPDSVNHPNFPSTELKPGQIYQSTTIFRFSTRK
jgi:aldose 1-epimerase